MSGHDGLKCLLSSLLDVLDGRCRPRLRVGWLVKVGQIAVRFTPAEGEKSMLILPIDKKAVLAILIQDAAGNPARVDGVPTWSVSDETFGELTVSADGMAAEYVPSGTLGSVQLNVQADADLGDGVKPLQGVLDIQIEAGEAAVIAINATVAPIT